MAIDIHGNFKRSGDRARVEKPGFYSYLGKEGDMTQRNPVSGPHGK